MIAFVLLCVLTPVTCVSVINCVDTETQSISPWRSSIAHTIKVVNGTRVFDYEGPSTSGNFELKFGEKLRVLGGERAYLFVEFVNESPRRLTVQPVKNEKGIDFVLLPGISGDGVQDSVEEIDTSVGEPSITGILRKPQHVMIRKLVIFKLRSNDREPVATIVSQLRANSCKMTTAPEPKSSQVTSPTQPPKPRVCSTATKSTEPTACPECKCVCNCNCNPEC